MPRSFFTQKPRAMWSPALASGSNGQSRFIALAMSAGSPRMIMPTDAPRNELSGAVVSVVSMMSVHGPTPLSK